MVQVLVAEVTLSLVLEGITELIATLNQTWTKRECRTAKELLILRELNDLRNQVEVMLKSCTHLGEKEQILLLEMILKKVRNINQLIARI